MTTELEATVDMETRIKAAWDAGALDIVGYEPLIIWPLKPSKVNEKDKYYARFSYLTSSGKKTSMGSPGIWTTTGTAYLQIFAPANDRKADMTLTALSALVMNAFRQGANVVNLNYGNVSSRNMPSETGWHCKRVQLDYTFSQLL